MGLLDWLKLASLASAVVKAWRETVAFFARLETKQAGRNEVVLEVKVNSDAVLDQADLARRERDAADTVGGQLREQDGHRRD